MNSTVPVVRNYCQKSDNEILDTEKKLNDPTYYFRWVSYLKNANFSTFKPGKQMVNLIPNINYVFGYKSHLLTTLMSRKEEIEARYKMKLNSFFPEEYYLNILSDLVSFINSPTDGLWI
jgi:hypothetical protein